MVAVNRPLDYAKHLVRKTVKPGDRVIDATAGNGKDTLFLADLVGERGKVFAFDIQEEAISTARQKLYEENLLERVELICDSHENINCYLDRGKISAVKFNLGYLPGGHHTITTQAEATLKSVLKCLELLKKGGIITIVVYTGHPEGKREKKILDHELSLISQDTCTVLSYRCINQKNYPPELLVVEKL